MKESRYNIWVDRDETSYVFNGVSGALPRVDAAERHALRDFLGGAAEPDCSPALLKQLALGRMLVGDHDDEIDLLAQRFAFSRDDSSQFALTIVTSLGCNFDCPYCYEAKHPSLLEPDVQAAVLQVLDDQLPKIRSFSVTWFGGEPLVGKQALLTLSDAFIERCDRAGVAYQALIITNGYLLDEQTCIELRDRRVKQVQVGLDGPPDVHDRMRPLAGGKGSFWGIIDNLRHAVNYLDMAVRVNVDSTNAGRTEELLQILAAEGFAGKLVVYPGRLEAQGHAPQGTLLGGEGHCFTGQEFAHAEREFSALATRYGFALPYLPRPTGAPCTAVRANELVVGSKGELYKCWDSVSKSYEVVGDIRDYRQLNGRLRKWLSYDPFADAECRGCVALPVCMGGCARHAMNALEYENRCSSFRYTYREQIVEFIDVAEQRGVSGPVSALQLARPIKPR